MVCGKFYTSGAGSGCVVAGIICEGISSPLICSNSSEILRPISYNNFNRSFLFFYIYNYKGFRVNIMYLWDFLTISAFSYRFPRKRIGEFSYPTKLDIAPPQPLDTKILGQHNLHGALPPIRTGHVGVHHFGAPEEPLRPICRKNQDHLICSYNAH